MAAETAFAKAASFLAPVSHRGNLPQNDPTRLD